MLLWGHTQLGLVLALPVLLLPSIMVGLTEVRPSLIGVDVGVGVADCPDMPSHSLACWGSLLPW